MQKPSFALLPVRRRGGTIEEILVLGSTENSHPLDRAQWMALITGPFHDLSVNEFNFDTLVEKPSLMDQQWMYADRRSKEFIEGVHYFLRVAKANKRNGFICCPCNKCKNQKEYSVSRTIYFHLFKSGFMPSYNCWTSNGEQGVEVEEDEAEDENIPDWAPLRAGAKKLDTTLEFLQWKAKNGVSDKAFGDLLKLIKNILPEGNKLPETTYEAKKIVCPLGLEVQKIHACPNDCILYRAEEYENLEACPVLKALRYKIRREDPGEVDGQPTKKRIPAKVMWYFPIIPGLRRLFRNKGNARMMRWHAEEHQQDGILRHPADGSQWQNIDRKFKDFGKYTRNIRFGLSTDGMNPFGEMSSGHSSWPVTMCIYNLLPWLCMKRKYIMMPIIIQGPKQPGNDIDVYIRPLVEDLKLLWKKEGVPVWDEDKQEEFNLRALLFVTINDWPTLSNLSGQSNKGYKACTHCMDETESTYLKHYRKVVYMGHHRFLAANHPVRKKGVYGKSKDTLEARNDLKHMRQASPRGMEFIEDLRPIGVPESRHEGRLRGKGTLGRKAIMTVDNNLFRKAHFTVLQHFSLVTPYIEEHLALVCTKNIGKYDAWITRHHIDTFPAWMRQHLMGNETINQQLAFLARGPSGSIATFQGYEINGFTFYTRAQDMKSMNHNGAVRIDAMGHDGTTGTYYGAIEDKWELDHGPLKVPLFRCQWVRLTGGGVTIDDSGMTTVDLNKVGYSDEPFVLANDVTQVFYVKDMSSKEKKGKGPDEPKRHVVLLGKRKIVGVEDKTDEDYDQFFGQPPFTVTIDLSILLSNEDTPYSRSDHKEGTIVRRKYVRSTVTADVLP
uniref:OSJNBa0035B13.7 protein n=1 Tax=Oryza sativa subsp. japonica TaxID=39947 RepID=Q7XVU4_ORYSJ|nr:OSJNBa0035B13.7 [Oryza sativa Japonica Group]